MGNTNRYLAALRDRLADYKRGVSMVLVVLLIGCFGFYALVSHAATGGLSAEAETGSTSGNACATSDSTASDSSAVKFGSTCVGVPSTPAATGAQVCGNSSILGAGPTSAPAGAITVAAGNNSSVDFGQANKTYWFAAGTHTLGTGQYSSIVPGNNATFIGAPGAIIDGQGTNLYAVQGNATGVTLEYLTFQYFGTGSTATTPSSSDMNEGVVNHNAGHNWTIKYSTVKYNAGAGVFVGTGDTLQYNCLDHNAQYGFSAYEDNGLSNVVLDHNEISYNNTYDWESHIDGCGCTGGGKFWATQGATITNNYVHDNYSTGIWADTNNTGFDIEGNYFADNSGEAIIYEISYNILIKNNNFISNAIASGKSDGGFPHPAVYISESGSDSRVSGPYGTTSQIVGNVFTNNWSGVIIWENSDRYCSSSANTSSGDCTLVNPSVANLTTCANASLLATTPYIDDCRWKSQNVSVTNNTFNMTPSAVSGCTAGAECGYVGIFAQWGSYAPYTGTFVEDHIINSQNNHFSNNTYNGTWSFMAKEQGTTVSWSQWQSTYHQDTGSTKS